MHPQILCAMGAANTGIEQQRVVIVLHVGLPRCLTTYLQEHGRNRNAGIYRVFTDWRLFVKLLLTILLPPKTPKSDEPDDYEFVNSMITARTPEKRAEKSTPVIEETAPLTDVQRRNNIVDGYNDFIQVLNFLFLPALGCLHVRAEWFLSRRVMLHLPEEVLHETCGGQCCVCNKKYQKWILIPIVYEGAV